MDPRVFGNSNCFPVGFPGSLLALSLHQANELALLNNNKKERTCHVLLFYSPIAGGNPGPSHTSSTFAAEKAGFTAELVEEVPPLDISKTMARDPEPEGWITFQSFGSKQIINFAPIMPLRCRLKEIKYPIDPKDLDKSFSIPDCYFEYPFRVEEESIHKPYIMEFPDGTVQAFAVQLTWDDGSNSKVVYYELCRVAGATPCAYPVGSND